MDIETIAYFHSPLTSKFGIPRQSSLVEELKGSIVFEPGFRSKDAVRGLADFDRIWVIWGFSANAESGWKPTVRPPRLGGNRSVGVFASRSPFRPNPLGLSSLLIERIDMEGPEAPVIHVRGADLMDGTPIYDIKPYLRYTDSHPGSKSGFADTEAWTDLEVDFPEELQERFLSVANADKESLKALTKILSMNPKPQYQNDAVRIYGLPFAGAEIKFRISGNCLTVIEII